MDTLVGQHLGKYEIQSELGRGGMGVVYRGYDAALRRSVAIKVLPTQLTYDAQFVQRFQQEAILAASLRHPNIVTIYDVGQQAGIYYIVMEYLEGATLEALLTRQGPMPAAQAGRILRQVADALDYAHRAGVIHRDVKPANIMIGPDGRATLMDFGLVRAAEGTNLTRTGTYLGTPEYMSPEQALGKPVDGASDTYSLGIVFYKVLCGKVPFSRSTPLGVTYAHVNEPPPPLRKVRAEISPAIEAVITKALAKQPADRYRTATLLADDFMAAAGAAPVALRTPIPTPPATRPDAAGEQEQTVLVGRSGQAAPRRMPLVLVGVLAALGVIVAGLIIVALTTGKRGAEPSLSAPTHTPAGPAATSTLAATRTGGAAGAMPTATPTALMSRTATPRASVQPTSTTAAVPMPAPPTATVAAAPTSSPPTTARPTAQARVASDTVNLRTGPGTTYGVAGQARQGDSLLISARNSDSSWWQVCCVKDQPVWVAAQMVTVEGDIGGVPVAEEIPSPPPSPPNAQCKPWHKKPAPGYGIILIENHLGEELSADYAIGGTGHWMIAAKRGDEPGRWWKEVLVGQHVINYTTPWGYGRASFQVEGGKSYVSPLWYNDRSDDYVFPMDIPAGCR
jgi:serine/threonine-protein kinase